MEQILVAQPLLAVRGLRSSGVCKFVEVYETAEPKMAVLLELSVFKWVAALEAAEKVVYFVILSEASNLSSI